MKLVGKCKKNKCKNADFFCEHCSRNPEIVDYYWSEKEWDRAIREAFKV